MHALDLKKMSITHFFVHPKEPNEELKGSD